MDAFSVTPSFAAVLTAGFQLCEEYCWYSSHGKAPLSPTAKWVFDTWVVDSPASLALFSVDARVGLMVSSLTKRTDSFGRAIRSFLFLEFDRATALETLLDIVVRFDEERRSVFAQYAERVYEQSKGHENGLQVELPAIDFGECVSRSESNEISRLSGNKLLLDTAENQCRVINRVECERNTAWLIVKTDNCHVNPSMNQSQWSFVAVLAENVNGPDEQNLDVTGQSVKKSG